MNNKEKISNLLGMAQRAGLLISGDFAAEKELRTTSKQERLVFLASDSGQDNEKKYLYKGESLGLTVNRMFTKVELGHAIGKAQRVIIIVNDTGFTKAILKLMR